MKMEAKRDKLKVKRGKTNFPASTYGLGDESADVSGEPNPGVVYEPRTSTGKPRRPDQLGSKSLLS